MIKDEIRELPDDELKKVIETIIHAGVAHYYKQEMELFELIKQEYGLTDEKIAEMIKFDDLHTLTNDCSDDSHEMYDEVMDMIISEIFNNIEDHPERVAKEKFYDDIATIIKSYGHFDNRYLTKFSDEDEY